VRLCSQRALRNPADKQRSQCDGQQHFAELADQGDGAHKTAASKPSNVRKLKEDRQQAGRFARR